MTLSAAWGGAPEVGKRGNWRIETMVGNFARRLIPIFVATVLTGALCLAVPGTSYAQAPPTQTDVDGLKDAARSEYASAAERADKARLWRDLAKAAREAASKALDEKDRKRWEKSAAKREEKAKNLDQESKKLIEAAKQKEAEAAKLQEAVTTPKEAEERDKAQTEEQDEEIAKKPAEEADAKPKNKIEPNEVVNDGRLQADGNTASVSLDTGTTTVTIPEKVVLTYSAEQYATESERRRGDCKPGGLRGGVECGVSKRFDESDKEGGTAAERIGASLTIPLTPRLEKIGNEFRLSLVVGEPDLSVSGMSQDIEVETRRRVRCFEAL